VLSIRNLMRQMGLLRSILGFNFQKPFHTNRYRVTSHKNSNMFPLKQDYFTVGTVVEVQGPETGRNGKAFLTFKFSNLVKHDMSRLRKNVLDNPLAFDNQQSIK
jgi:hypothetical protein